MVSHTHRIFCLLLGILFVGLISADAIAQNRGSGLPLPRFVSLRSDEVNLRTGPGVQYPVDWVYKRQGLPAEIIAEHDTWRKVRDWQGTQGWIHQSMLSGRRAFIVVGNKRTLRARPSSDSRAAAYVEVGVVGYIIECESASSWCQVEADGITGWLRRVEIWGAYRGEEIK